MDQLCNKKRFHFFHHTVTECGHIDFDRHSNFKVIMIMSFKNTLTYIGIGLCLFVGLYPAAIILAGHTFELLNSKCFDLLSSTLYLPTFYVHVISGGIALLIGWPQFINYKGKSFRFHRVKGIVYVVSVLFSGLSGLYISFFANGGFIARLGFGCMSIAWLVVTYQGYHSVRKGLISKHQKMMRLSFAVTCAAITFRLWVPSLGFLLDDFVQAYQLSAWLCWVLNLMAVGAYNFQHTPTLCLHGQSQPNDTT